jgi:hypothetical protein
VYVSGMNKMVCSNMKINFLAGKIDNFSAYVKPDAQFIPPHEIKEEDEKLKGFIWRADERPVREDVVKTGKRVPEIPKKEPKKETAPPPQKRDGLKKPSRQRTP